MSKNKSRLLLAHLTNPVNIQGYDILVKLNFSLFFTQSYFMTSEDSEY